VREALHSGSPAGTGVGGPRGVETR
jgi:hypothetical protein